MAVGLEGVGSFEVGSIVEIEVFEIGFGLIGTAVVEVG